MRRLDILSPTAKAPGFREVRSSRRLEVLGLLLALVCGLLLTAPALAGANPITDENALPGNAGWEVSQADTPNIEGYTDKTSVAPGETIGFHVSTKPSASYRINIYRLGWYDGDGARLMTCLPTCSSNSSGSARSTPNPNSKTGKIDAGWPTSNSLTIPSSWTTGEYVAEYTLKSGSEIGYARYSPFLVRSNAPQAQASNILVVVPYNTYLAYNAWGGTSAYVNDTNESIFKLAHATKVSFNRPFDRKHWSYWDLPLLRFLEREGYDVSYVSDTDVDANPQILQQHRTVIVSGHSEYWSKNMRDGFDTARDAGTNLFFAGANNAYWQVRYEDSSCASDDTICGNVGNRRTMVIYKQEESNQVDPISNPALKTIKWRDLGRPECELQGGVQYGSWFPNDGYADYKTTAAGASDPWNAGTGLTSGSTVKGLVGFEFDSFFPDCDVPGTPTILFSYQSAFTDADIDAAAVRYTDDSSGARVFSSGSEQWAWGLDSYRWDPTLFTGIPPTNPAIQQYTRNILADMSRPAPPEDVDATLSGGSIQIDTTPRSDDPRITGYKVYRHSGSGAFQPGDPGVTLVCQNSSGDCTDTPGGGTYRYASVAVDQWNDSSAVLSGSVTITSPVTANPDSATVSEDAVATGINVLANDTPSGVTKTITGKTNGAHGTVVITGGGTGLTYQPNSNYCGSDSFTYTINSSSTATVTMTVTCVDDPPTAVNDSATVAEDAGATAVGVLDNDTDIDGGPKTVASFSQASHGTVSGVGPSGAWTDLKYQPDANYCGSDSFTYALNGGDPATVSMTVTCVDDLPMAVDDSKTVTEDAGATAIGVLSNDTDPDGGPKAVTSFAQPTHGTVTGVGSSGAWSDLRYKPDADYCGSDSFTYAITGGDMATVSMTVSCLDDPPTAVNDSATVTEDADATPINVLANDTDIDGGPMTINTKTNGAHGTVVITGGGSGLTYQPSANYCGSDSFTYTLNGDHSATVSMTVTCVDDPPTAVNDSQTIQEDDPATAVNVLGNDTDVDGGPKTINSKTNGAHGTVVITGGGTGLTYQPAPNYCGPDSFTYTLTPGADTATVSMTVSCVDDPPDAVNDSFTVSGDSGANEIDVLTNDTDIDGGPMTIISVTQPAHGAVAMTGGGSGLTYQPNPGACDSDTFTYKLNGGDTATVTITIDCTQAPTAVGDAVTVPQDSGPSPIDALANDTDPDGGPKAIESITQPANGTAAITGGGSALTYQPNAGYCNSLPGMTLDGFLYTLNGGSTASVSVTVTCPAGGVEGGSTANPKPPKFKCKKKAHKKGKAKCKKKKKSKRKRRH
jgi:hypothetical protein